MSIEKTSCDFCRCEEGKPRPIGQYNVVLTKAIVKGESVYACQSCLVNNREIFSNKQVDVMDLPETELNPSLLQRLKDKLSNS